MDDDNKELCMMQITFPVESDEKAIEYKRKISEVLAGMSEARIQFSLMTSPANINNGTRVR